MGKFPFSGGYKAGILVEKKYMKSRILPLLLRLKY